MSVRISLRATAKKLTELQSKGSNKISGRTVKIKSLLNSSNFIKSFFVVLLIFTQASCSGKLSELWPSFESAKTKVNDPNKKPAAKPENAAQHLNKPIVVMISIDGFAADYFKKYKTPTLNAWANEGISARMIPSFPTLTFPNHVTLVTGLYPGRHGIVGNNFYDEKRKEGYEMGKPSSNDGTWYLGEPIWTVAENNKMVSATYFWVGSEARIGGKDPSYFQKYDGAISTSDRVKKVIEWLQLPPLQRPHYIALYFSAVDDAGHAKGPDSKEVGDAITEIDTQLGVLKNYIDRNTRDVQVIIVSDHGMKKIEKTADLSAATNLMKMKDSRRGAVAYFYSDDPKLIETAYQEVVDIQTKNPGLFQVYKAADLPAKWHLDNPDRRGDIIVVGEPGVYIGFKRSFEPGNVGSSNLATHGWDSAQAPELDAIFIASGSMIKKGMTIPPFENVHVYPFVLDLLGLQAVRSIDGDLAVLGPFRK